MVVVVVLNNLFIQNKGVRIAPCHDRASFKAFLLLGNILKGHLNLAPKSIFATSIETAIYVCKIQENPFLLPQLSFEVNTLNTISSV